MSSAYRSAYDHIVGLKRDEVREAREELAPLLPGLRDITQARISRIVGGTSGLIGAVAMCWYAATTHDASASLALIFGMIGLALSWLLMRAVLVVAGRFKKLRPEPELTGQLDADLALIDEHDVRREVRAIEARAEKLETASIAVPIAGITFLMPLFLHWLCSVVLFHESTRDFSEWIRISMVIVGHAHIALAILGYLFARKLHRSDNETIGKMNIHREWARIWLITIGVSCLPGIVLILVPPILVALTGIAFIPFMIMALRSAVLQERLKLALAAPARVRIQGLDIPAALAEEEKREADRDDEDAGADTRDRAQA